MINRQVLIYLILIIFFWPKKIQSQVKVSSFLQSSTFYSDIPEAKLFMIEFWATWCGPCIAVSDYLEVLQKQFIQDLYILSLSQESKDRVQQFLKKRPGKFAYAIDYDGQTFEKYKVGELPFGILLNANSEVVWKGNPADLTPYQLRNLIRKNKEKFNPKQLIDISAYAMEDNSKENLESTFELTLSDVEPNSGITIFRHQNYKQIEGNLQQILGYLLAVSPVQVEIPKILNKGYFLKLKHHEDLSFIAKNILQKLDFKFQVFDKNMDVFLMKFTNDKKFWGSSQFSWGLNSSQYLVDDFQFSADDTTLADFFYKLSELLDVSIIYNQELIDPSSKFDWQLHYKYFDLMSEDLHQNFGIEIEKINKPCPVFYITD